MLFKRKKTQPSTDTESCIDMKATANTDETLEEVNVEEVAKEVAEEITVYEKQVKAVDATIVPDYPTVKIPNLKVLSEELATVQTEGLNNQNDVDNAEDEENMSVDDIIAEAKNKFIEEPTRSDNEPVGIGENESIQQSTESDIKIDTKTGTDENLESSELPDTEITNAEEDIPKEPAEEIAKKPKKKKINPLLQAKKKSTFRRKKEFKHKVSLFANILMWGISVLLFVFCLSNLYQQIGNTEKAVGFFNTGNAVVVSESMVPYLEKNDFIIYKAMPIEKLAPQDVVVYKRPAEDGHILIVHRLLSISDGYAITKGDNNSVQDEPFDANNIVGKVVLIVPQLGLAMNALSSFKGVVILAVLFCLFALSQFLYRKMTYKVWLKKIAIDKDERKAVQIFLDMQ